MIQPASVRISPSNKRNGKIALSLEWTVRRTQSVPSAVRCPGRAGVPAGPIAPDSGQRQGPVGDVSGLRFPRGPGSQSLCAAAAFGVAPSHVNLMVVQVRRARSDILPVQIIGARGGAAK
jgi:hypothetical protein